MFFIITYFFKLSELRSVIKSEIKVLSSFSEESYSIISRCLKIYNILDRARKLFGFKFTNNFEKIYK